MRLIYGNRNCTYHSEEKLKEFKNKTIIIVSNHIKPRSKFLKVISMPYDAYILRKLFMKYGIYTTALTSVDSFRRNEKTLFHAMKEKLIKGIIESIDLIPVNRKEHEGKTMQEIQRRVRGGNLGIGIFPEGTWFRGYRKNRKLHGGMAVLSKRYNLPILPVYINAYNLKGRIDIRVGDAILGVNDAAELCKQVRDQFDSLHAMTV